MHQSKNVEVHVVDQCNLDCVGCSHEAPFLPRRNEDPVVLHAALTALWRHYRTPLVKLLGGEPLLHPSIDRVIQAVTDATGARIRLVTNGTLLRDRYPALAGVAEIHISAYPGVKIPSTEELVTISSALDAPITLEAFGAFRWHRLATPSSSEQTNDIFETCQLYHVWECHTVRGGWFFPCPPPATWGDQSDGVHLLGDDDEIRRGLTEVLERNAPFSSCRTCLGSTGALLQHRRGWRGFQQPLDGATVDVSFLTQLKTAPDAWNECYEYKFTVHPNGEVVNHS